jgi:hypothetical protein
MVLDDLDKSCVDALFSGAKNVKDFIQRGWFVEHHVAHHRVVTFDLFTAFWRRQKSQRAWLRGVIGSPPRGEVKLLMAHDRGQQLDLRNSPVADR